MRMKRDGAAMLATMALLGGLFPVPAAAHLNPTGMGPVYDGLLHFWLSPEDVAPVVALSLFAGLRGPAYGRRALWVLPVSWFVGCLLGTIFQWGPSWPVSAIGFLVFGGLVAANARWPLSIMTVLAAGLGLTHGWLNGAGLRWSLSLLAVFAGLAGAIFVLVALVSALVIALRPPWTRIAVRVIGSWIVASGLLLLGWAARVR
jgi:hydrogenase/urease accessory protein HupE